jgi:hypothetical protein
MGRFSQRLLSAKAAARLQLVCLARVRGRAAEYRTMVELFRSEKTREHLLKVAADYESMADQEATFELEDAHHAAGSRHFNFGSRLMFGGGGS